MKILDNSRKRKLNPLYWDRGAVLAWDLPKKKEVQPPPLGTAREVSWMHRKLASMAPEMEKPTIRLLSAFNPRNRPTGLRRQQYVNYVGLCSLLHGVDP